MRRTLLTTLFGDGGLLRVRAFLALGLTAVTSYMWVMEIPISDQQIAILAAVVFNYFGTRGAESAIQKLLATAEETDAPVHGGPSD